MTQSKTLEQKIQSIFERNERVEKDKAWETSLVRRITLAAATYLVVLYFLLLINAPNPYFNSLVPAGAYLVQQYSIPFLKKIWENKFYKK